MKRYVRRLADGQTTVITVPSLDFSSLQTKRLEQLRKFFTKASKQVTGPTAILDLTDVKAAGAGFLTEVFYLAKDLEQAGAELIIAGELFGLLRLAGWQRRFRVFHDLFAAITFMRQVVLL